MTPDELRTVGEALYGVPWQTKLAKAIPVDARTVRRWLAGKTRIHPAMAARIRSLKPKKSKKDRQ